jgi:hypothetical protein
MPILLNVSATVAATIGTSGLQCPQRVPGVPSPPRIHWNGRVNRQEELYRIFRRLDESG